MISSLRLSTALVTSMSLVLSNVPMVALAQGAPLECLPGEGQEACLARTLEEAAAAEAAAQAEVGAAADADAEAAAAAAQAEAAAAAAAAASAEADAEAAAAAAQAEADAAAAAAAAQAEADAAAAAAAQADADAAAAAAAEQAEAAAAAAQAEADAAAAAAEAAAEAEAAAQSDAETAAALDAAQAEAETAAAAAEAEAAEAAAAEAAAAEAAAAEAAAAEAAAAEAGTGGNAEVTDADAIAEALEAAQAEEAAQAAQAEEGAQETATAPGEAPLTIQDIPAEDAEALAAAAAAADAAENAAATPVDPIVQAEAEVQVEAAEAEQQMQSLVLSPGAAAATGTVTEVITEDMVRSAEEEFSPIVSTEGAATAGPRNNGRNGGLTTLEAALLAGAAGLVVGTIIGGNRQVVNRADDRVVVLRPDGDYQVIRDDDVLLRRPGNGVTTETFADGSSRSVVVQPDGGQVITVRDRDLRIIQRTYVAPNGIRTVLIDDTVPVQPVVISQLPQVRPVASTPIIANDADALRRALEGQGGYDRAFSLAQIRSIRAVRELAPVVDLENLTFASGSAAIGPDQAQPLLALGRYMSDAIARNPREVFLVEGHTDAVGSGAFNLALSDRRAESVALALAQYFGVPAQNMVIQGYGEDYLRVPTLADERLNRRVAVRRVTDLLQVASN